MSPEVPTPFEDITIARIITERVSDPLNDGSAGSALYAVPFELSRPVPGEWASAFEHNWDHPPQFTSMHRPGICRVSGTSVVLDGTTLEEVERYHRETLLLVLKTTNQQYREWKQRKDAQEARRQSEQAEHRRSVEDVAQRIRFDE